VRRAPKQGADEEACDEELDGRRDAARPVPAAQAVARKELPAARSGQAKDVFEVRARRRERPGDCGIERSAYHGEEQHAADAREDLEAAVGDVLMRHSIACDVQEEPDRQRAEPRADERTAGRARRDVEGDDHAANLAGGTVLRIRPHRIGFVATRPSESPTVLETTPPRFSANEAARIAGELFGVAGTAVDLGSERDQAFLIDDGDGGGGVLKISNSSEDPGVLDLETEAILHVTRVDPGLPVARPRAAAGAGDGPAAYRPTIEGPAATHFVRVFERLRGRVGGPELDDAAVYEYGATHARLNLALRAFFHPAAGRGLLWDLKRAAELRALLGSIGDESRRGLVDRVLDRYEQRVLPRWPRLRAQVVHGDFNLDNVLLDERGSITGIADFGDTVHTAQVADFAVGVASLLRGRPGGDVFRVARIAVDGYASRAPLEPEELEVLADLVAARLASIVTISAWRAARYPDNAQYIQAWDADSWQLLEVFDATGADEVAYELGAARPPVSTDELARRRRSALGPALSELTYRESVHVVRGEGAWLFDADGRRLLDAYNNVPVVGHCHPRVTEAVVRQTRAVNTHARYLYEPLIELAERVAASMPPEAGLDTVMLVNSASEANEIAWRTALVTTGRRGAIVTEHAYHGVTAAAADLSPEEWPEDFRPPNVETIAPPGMRRPLDAEMARAIERLKERGAGLAATYIDSGFTSDGIRVPAPGELETIVRETRAAGGLLVADEVQAGHGRTGERLWAFMRYGISPDVVTLGKPMGNGYPVAAVITRKEIVDRLAERARLFSTFGGNPVAARAALAVLEVIEDERLIENAARVGSRLLRALEALRGDHSSISDVRGSGLLIGVELVADARGSAPDAGLAERVVDSMRERGVLIGRTGPNGNVLKIRPPLVFADEHADAVVDALDRGLADASL
jgi:4-aminobutyrate aminotransferase-like enzyme/Ser/Thr protein kinase RdoA (MazF antagonist)